MDQDLDRGWSDEDAPVRTRQSAPATKPRRTFGGAVLAATAVAALGVGFGAGWISHGSGTSSSATTAVHGTLTLPDGGYSSVGTTCSGSGGYQDISPGVAVTIGDQSGKTLAVTSLGTGGFGGGGCQFTFSAKVPAAASYTVTISHRGTQVFPASAVPAGFNLTLGG